jgi:hypothetical protein
MHATPAYDRACGVSLGSDAAAAFQDEDEAQGLQGGTPGGERPAKRQRLNNSRCFNCGSYAHGLRECALPRDPEAVEAARAAQQAAAGARLPSGSVRYFLEGGGSASASKVRVRLCVLGGGGGGAGAGVGAEADMGVGEGERAGRQACRRLRAWVGALWGRSRAGGQPRCWRPRAPIAPLPPPRRPQAQRQAGEAQQYEGLQPGRMSGELAQALGLAGPLQPPPWLHRMVALGLPPAYQRAAAPADGATAAAADADAGAGDGFVIVGEGGEEEVLLLMPGGNGGGGGGGVAAAEFPGGLLRQLAGRAGASCKVLRAARR